MHREFSGEVPCSCDGEFLHFDLIRIGWYNDFNCHPLFAKFDGNSNTTFFAPSVIREPCSDFHKASLARPSTPESCRIEILPPRQIFGQALHEPVPGAASTSRREVCPFSAAGAAGPEVSPSAPPGLPLVARAASRCAPSPRYEGRRVRAETEIFDTVIFEADPTRHRT
jgi:hypothetical protein